MPLNVRLQHRANLPSMSPGWRLRNSAVIKPRCSAQERISLAWMQVRLVQIGDEWGQQPNSLPEIADCTFAEAGLRRFGDLEQEVLLLQILDGGMIAWPAFGRASQLRTLQSAEV